MGTTALSVLKSSFIVLIGDSNEDYSGNYENAINNASREISDNLFIPLDNMDLITGNILPTFNWATSSTLDVYTEPTGTLAQNTDATYIWNGSSSAKLTASGANDYLYINSDSYRRLLDCMGKGVSLYGFVYPEVADDVFLDIITTQKDGTGQALNSETTTYAGKKCLIELEDQTINDDIEHFEVRLRVKTTLKYSYFDMPYLIGANVSEYLLPKNFQEGILSSVQIQTTGDCDDLHPANWETVYDYKVVPDGDDKYLRLPSGYSTKKRIRLIGSKKLEDDLSSDTDTISIDGKQVNLLLTYAAGKLFQMESDELQYTIDSHTDAITAVDVEIDTEHASITTIEASIATIQGVIDTAVAAVATVASEDISRYDATIKRNQEQIDRLDKERERLNNTIERFEAERTRIHQRRSESKDVMKQLKIRSLEWFKEYYRLLPSLKITAPPVYMNLPSLF